MERNAVVPAGEVGLAAIGRLEVDRGAVVPPGVDRGIVGLTAVRERTGAGLTAERTGVERFVVGLVSQDLNCVNQRVSLRQDMIYAAHWVYSCSGAVQSFTAQRARCRLSRSRTCCVHHSYRLQSKKTSARFSAALCYSKL